MRSYGIDLIEEPEILLRCGPDIASGGGDESIRSVPVGDAFERASLQPIDLEIALGVA